MKKMKGKQGTQGGQGGFTLIELLIVVAIIGILAAIAIPQYANYQVSAAEGACRAELSAARTPVILNNNTIPDGYEWSACNGTPAPTVTNNELVGIPDRTGAETVRVPISANPDNEEAPVEGEPEV